MLFWDGFERKGGIKNYWEKENQWVHKLMRCVKMMEQGPLVNAALHVFLKEGQWKAMKMFADHYPNQKLK